MGNLWSFDFFVFFYTHNEPFWLTHNQKEKLKTLKVPQNNKNKFEDEMFL